MKLVYSYSFSLLLIIPLLSSLPVVALGDILQFPHVEAEFVTEREGVTPGIAAEVALRIKPEAGWHLYWRNSGDSGASPKLTWKVEDQSLNLETQWPAPEIIQTKDFVNYGYSKEVYLLASIPIPYNSTDAISLGLDAEWLVCEEECIPANAEFKTTLPIVQEDLPTETKHAKEFARFQKLVPGNGESLNITALPDDGSAIILRFPSNGDTPSSLHFLPYIGGIFDKATAQSFQVNSDGEVSLRLPISQPLANLPKELTGILLRQPSWSEGVAAKEVTFRSAPPIQAKEKKAISLLSILSMAFIGGIILNLMPCVFPVLSIKILSFVKKAGKEQNKVRRHGLAFAFGILLSFWILAIVIRSLRAAGEHLGWGFQLQEPAFVAALVLLLVAVALNLFGVFEFGSSIQRACGSIETKGEGYFTSFLSGVLATVLATPCTAPFMGGALAFALSTTLIPSLAVFTALALGLATPYLLFSFFPALLSQLPKPGLWMETLREFMGFPVLLTALWLIWVFQQQSDAGAILSLLAAVLLLSFALWVYGKICPPTASRKRQIGGLLLVMASLISCAWIGLPLQRPGRSELQTPQSNENTNISIDKHGLAWHRYSQSVIDSAIKDGQAVFIDFTAAWCVTCQVNKKVVFSSSEVTHTIREKNILLVRGDWTNEDPVITDALRQFNRVGVPLNVLYNPKTPEDPVVFPSVLTPQLVLDEFRKLQ